MLYSKALLPLVFIVLFGSFSVDKREEMRDRSLTIDKPSNTFVVYRRNQVGLKLFMDAMARRESNNHLTVISSRGYLGKYQFHQRTLQRLGIFVSDSEFLNNAQLQDSAMILLLKQNDRELHSIIVKYSGEHFNGIYVTRSGILAGAHLVGPGGVRAFFDSTLSFPTQDSNGTTVGEYISQFSGYSFRLN